MDLYVLWCSLQFCLNCVQNSEGRRLLARCASWTPPRLDSMVCEKGSGDKSGYLVGNLLTFQNFWRIKWWADSLYFLFTNISLLMLMLFVYQPLGSVSWCFYVICRLSPVWFWETWSVREAGSKDMLSSNVAFLFSSVLQVLFEMMV